MALLAVDEALRNVVAVGADPARTAILDNFCWGNPHLPDRLGGLVRAAQGCHDAAVAFRVPFISGKDSLFNEYRLADGSSRPIPGTLLISAIGIVPDIAARDVDVSQTTGKSGLPGRRHRRRSRRIARAAPLRPTGSEAPVAQLSSARRVFSAVHRANRKGLMQACHDLSEGGLAVAAAEMAIAGGHGLEIDVRDVPVAEPGLADSTRAVCRVSDAVSRRGHPGGRSALETLLGRTPHARIGRVLDSPRFRALGQSGVVIDANIDTLRSRWQAPLAEATMSADMVTACSARP